MTNAMTEMTLDALDEALRTLILDLRRPDAGSDADLNRRIGRVASGDADANVGKDYVADLAAAMSLLPIGTWFHWSHLGFSVILTKPVAGAPVTNATDYHPEGAMNAGAPVSYEASARDSVEARASLPRLVCQATMMARRAQVAKALARRDGRHRLVQTGHGPMLASPGGKLVHLPHDSRFTSDGRIVPHDDEKDGPARIEDPDA